MVSVDIKLLNTVLSGCEYSIVNDHNLFIVVNKIWLSENEKLEVPDNAILIPNEGDDACNFSIRFGSSSEEQEQKNYIFVFYQSGEEEQIELKYNQIYTIGNVKIAAKLSTDEWQYPIADSIENNKEQDVVKNKSKIPLGWKISKKMIYFSIIVALCLFTAFFSWYRYTEPNRRVNDVEKLFTNESLIKVLLGTDKTVYILTQSKKEVQLVLDAFKNDAIQLADNIIVKELNQEKKELSNWLSTNWPMLRVNSLNLDNVESPILFLSKQRSSRLSFEEKQRLQSALKNQRAYIKNVQIEYLDDQVLVEQAVNGLKQLNVNYHIEKNQLYNAFIIQGEINDADLFRLKNFVLDYQNKWGGGYVRFVITISDELFKNSSFKRGEQNYIKLSNNHWYVTFN